MTERTQQMCLITYATITTACIVAGAGLIDRGHDVPPWLTGLAGAALGNFTTLVTLLVARNGKGQNDSGSPNVSGVWPGAYTVPPPDQQRPPPPTR